MFWLGLLVAVAFYPGALDPAGSARWAVLAVGAPLLLILHGKGIPRPLSGLGAIVLLTAGASALWSPSLLNAMDELAHLAILAGVFCLGASREDLTPAWRGLAAGVTISAALALAQLAGLDLIEQRVAPAGLFMNKNLLAEAGMIALLPALASGAWLIAMGPALAVLAGASKAVGAALAAVGAVYLWRRRRAAAATLWAVLGATGAFLFLTEHQSAVQRSIFWAATLQDLTWLGHGLGSFAALHPELEHAHSEPLQIVFELGVLAILPALLLAHLWGGKDLEPEHLVLAAVLAVGLFSFPLHQPATGFAAALAAGALARRRAHLLGAEPHRAGALPGHPQGAARGQ